MAVAFRSDQDVTNGTAGTSVTVSKPSGIVDTGDNAGRDQLIAFIAATGAPTFSAPAGWTLITTAVDAGNNVTLKAYRKLASSEGASWTWTLGSAQRNWGWVGAYTGVDPDAPLGTATTDITLDTSTTLQAVGGTKRPGSMILGGFAAVRAASADPATTWSTTTFDMVALAERLDTSTNAAAGTDIAGTVVDDTWPEWYEQTDFFTAVASQAQTAGAGIGFLLLPYFVPYDGAVNGTGFVLEAAFGVDPDSDSSGWTWTDLTSYVHHPAKVVLRHGRANRSSVADPSELRFTLLNLTGEFTGPAGTYAADMVRNLPFRVRLTGFGEGATLGYHRGTMFLASLQPRWDVSTNFAVVDIVANGRLRRTQQRTDALRSPAYRTMIGIGSTEIAPIAFWPFEDESAATQAASAVSGVAAIGVTGVDFAASSLFDGAAPLATLNTNTVIAADVPAHTATGEWAVVFGFSLPTEPAGTTVVGTVTTTGGTARTWRVSVVPGTTAVQLDVLDFGGASLLSTNFGVTEADFYGHPILIEVAAATSGSDIAYALYSGQTGGATGTISSNTCGTPQTFTVTGSAGLDGATFGLLGVYVDTSYVQVSTVVDFGTAAVDAHAGEWPWSRFFRLCREEGIRFSVQASQNQNLTMGPQTVDTLMSLLRECEVVEGNVLNDSGESANQTGLLWFPAQDDRLNIDATLTLDLSAGQVAPGFEPALDDQDIVNDVEVSRPGGSSARATDTASIAAEGRYREFVTANTVDDTYLFDMASWRVHLGTVRGMRFPSVAWNMRKSPTLAEQWMATRLFHRVDITNPPSQYPPDDIRAILEGYTETFSADEWTVRANLSPYAPWAVGTYQDASVVAADQPTRYDGQYSTTNGSFVSGAGSLSVATSQGPLWSTSTLFPMYVSVHPTGRPDLGITLTVSAISGSSSPQTFTVTASNRDGVTIPSGSEVHVVDRGYYAFGG